jgi:NitT/TauT family transport system substrate-binding protein
MTAPAMAQSSKKSVFAMSWVPSDHHAPYWVALEKGYYAREGFDVDIQYSRGSADSTAKVDSNRADFAITEATSAIAAMSRGAKVKIVSIVFNRSPLTFVVWNDSPIKTPKDLVGKTLADAPGSAQRVLFPALAKVIGIDAARVSWVNVDPGAKIGALTAKRVDAVTDYTTYRPLYEKAMGNRNVRLMTWADYGLDLYSVAIIARTETVEKNPQMVSKFLKATYEGWRDSVKDPGEAVRIFKKRVPELDSELVRTAFEGYTLPLVKTREFEERGLGWIDPARMCMTVEVANDHMGFDRKVNCADVYQNKLLPLVRFAG